MFHLLLQGDEEGEEEEELEEESEDEDLPDPTSNKFFVQEIRVHGLPAGKGIPTQVPCPGPPAPTDALPAVLTVPALCARASCIVPRHRHACDRHALWSAMHQRGVLASVVRQAEMGRQMDMGPTPTSCGSAGGPVCGLEVPAGLRVHAAGAVRRPAVALPVSSSQPGVRASRLCVHVTWLQSALSSAC